jgi:hypothetical protein
VLVYGSIWIERIARPYDTARTVFLQHLRIVGLSQAQRTEEVLVLAEPLEHHVRHGIILIDANMALFYQPLDDPNVVHRHVPLNSLVVIRHLGYHM